MTTSPQGSTDVGGRKAEDSVEPPWDDELMFEPPREYFPVFGERGEGPFHRVGQGDPYLGQQNPFASSDPGLEEETLGQRPQPKALDLQSLPH